MNDSVLRKFKTGPRAEAETLPNVEGDSLEDLGAFGWLRGVRDRAIMLELRRKDGSIAAFGYAWLNKLEFNPSDGVTLHFSGETVRIAGRNLNGEARPNVRLVAGIARHRVPWIQEADGPAAMSAAKNAVVIEEIAIK
jgi:hypothetical protein